MVRPTDGRQTDNKNLSRESSFFVSFKVLYRLKARGRTSLGGLDSVVLEHEQSEGLPPALCALLKCINDMYDRKKGPPHKGTLAHRRLPHIMR